MGRFKPCNVCQKDYHSCGSCDLEYLEREVCAEYGVCSVDCYEKTSFKLANTERIRKLIESDYSIRHGEDALNEFYDWFDKHGLEWRSLLNVLLANDINTDAVQTLVQWRKENKNGG